ncbi:MAG: SigE family RNA polymerase sigma factor [Nocardioidaceae bacterium]
MEQVTAAEVLAASYESFVQTRSATLLRTAFLLTGSSADAEDLVQITLIKLFVAWPRATVATSPEAYARRVMLNAFISGRRPARFRREKLVRTPPEFVAAELDPSDRLTVWPLVLALPTRQRAVVVLRYYSGLTEAEIAEALGCAPGTVKSTASAALKHLRDQMGEPQ